MIEARFGQSMSLRFWKLETLATAALTRCVAEQSSKKNYFFCTALNCPFECVLSFLAKVWKGLEHFLLSLGNCIMDKIIAGPHSWLIYNYTNWSDNFENPVGKFLGSQYDLSMCVCMCINICACMRAFFLMSARI